jgi:hypothetical protein
MFNQTVSFALIWISAVLCLSATAFAQEPTPQSQQSQAPPSTDGQAKADLSVEQAQLADRWERLEQIAARLAELSASTDPHRADLLRKAIAQAREKEVHLRFQTVIGLLENERYSVATKNQETLEAELQQLLELLLKENRAEELRSQQAWLKMQLQEVNRIIRLQRGVKARTEGGDDTERLAEDQGKIGERTGGLADQIEAAQGGAPDGAQGESGKGGSQSESKEGEEEAQAEQEGDAGEQNGENSQESGDEGDDPSDSPQSNDPKPTESSPSSPQESPSREGEGGPQSGQPQEGQAQPGQAQSQPGQQAQPSQGQPSQGQGTPSEGGEGEGSQGQQPPSSNPDENLQRRLRAAQENMERARQKLDEAEASGATDEQEKALRELEEARAELERILRQLREEEMERTLALLEVRFRRMLEMQVAVYEGTQRLDKLPQASRDHDDEIEAGRLSRQEESIAREADKCLEILLEEGTSVAFPEAVVQMRTDMQEVTQRLAKLDVGQMTQHIEEEIIAQLEETIEALQQALEDLEKNRTPPGQAPPPGEPQDPPLVDMIEEVKMIRALQMRINRRTQRYAEMTDGNIATEPAVVLQLRQLAERQERVYKATRDLHLGKNR